MDELEIVYCCDCKKYDLGCREGDWITGGCNEGIKDEKENNDGYN